METVWIDYFAWSFSLVVVLSMLAIIWGPTIIYLHKLKAMLLKGQHQSIIKYGQAKYGKPLLNEFSKEKIAMYIIGSALTMDNFDLAFSYIDKLTLRQYSQTKALYYMSALLLTGDISKAEEIFSDFSNRKDPISMSVVVRYKPYFEFIATRKPIDETFLQAMKAPIQIKIYSKLNKKL